MDTLTLRKPALRVTAFVLAVLAIPFVGMALSDEVAWSLGDFILAGALLSMIGAAFEVAARRSGNVTLGAVVTTLGVAAAGIGATGDVPGLVLLGAFLAAGGAAIVYRRTQRLPTSL